MQEGAHQEDAAPMDPKTPTEEEDQVNVRISTLIINREGVTLLVTSLRKVQQDSFLK